MLDGLVHHDGGICARHDERQNQLDLALREIGRVERTLFMLAWLESPTLRRRC